MRGVHTALVTPFRADGAVDIEAFERLCARQIKGGIHGLVPCGTTGESPTLSGDEWSALVSAARRVAAGRVPVTAGVGTNATRSTVEKCVKAQQLGADAGLMVLPYYNKPNPAGLRAHVREAASVGLPLVLYHVPGRTGQRVGHELLAELTNMDGVVGLKEATGDIRYGVDVVQRTKVPVLSGDDFTFLGLMAMGGSGVISVVSNVDPAGTVAVSDAFFAGDRDRAIAANARLWDLMTFLFADSNPIPCKAALAALDLCRAEPRLPLAPYEGPSPIQILEALGLR
jgi:4-hydroxy-tetrahydrodipicolinate synthase